VNSNYFSDDSEAGISDCPGKFMIFVILYLNSPVD